MEEAAADLGDNAWWTFWRVTFPMVFPGVLASLLLCFTISFDEFIMAFFLAGTEPTLPIFIYSQLRFPAEAAGRSWRWVLAFWWFPFWLSSSRNGSSGADSPSPRLRWLNMHAQDAYIQIEHVTKRFGSRGRRRRCRYKH